MLSKKSQTSQHLSDSQAVKNVPRRALCVFTAGVKAPNDENTLPEHTHLSSSWPLGGVNIRACLLCCQCDHPHDPSGVSTRVKKKKKNSKTTIKVKASRLALKMLTGWMCCTQTRHQCLFWIFCGLFQRFVPEQTPTRGNQQITAAYNILISPTQLYQLSPFKTTVAETVSIREYKSNKIQLTITI